MPSQEQKTAKRYFEPKTGCPGFIIEMITGVKDEAYDQIVMSKLNGLNLRQKAIARIGLDEDQLKEIPPVYFHGYGFKGARSRYGADGRARTSKYEVAYLFFSSSQVYMYSYTFDLINDSKQEKAEEYFYKDVTNFTTYSETEVITTAGCTGKETTKNYDTNLFSLSAGGEKFICSISGVADADKSINAMKQKLREKKG